MGLVPETLRIDLVDVLGARGSRGEPAVLRRDFDPADRRVVSRRLGEHLLDAVAGERGRAYLRLVELRELFLLGRRRGRFHTIRERLAQVARERAVGLAGIAAAAGRDLGGEQCGHDAVLVGAPGAPVPPQERGARALFAAEPEIS